MTAAGDVTRKPVITLIGAGSSVFGFNMCMDICQTAVLKGAEIRLVDLNAERLAVMRRLFELVSEKTGMALRIQTQTDRAKALPRSDFVIVAVARERVERWDKDLEISRRHGIVETQGECGGPGGLSLTLRNIPLLLEIARDVERLAPKALIINFSNPMTRVCLAICRYTKANCVGLCHGLLGAQNMLADLLGRKVIVRGCGINHFNWISDAVWADNGQSCWEVVKEKFPQSDLPHWKYTRELFKVFGAVVSPGDGHIADFIHHWRGEKDGLHPDYDLHPKAMPWYRTFAADWEQRMNDYLCGKRDPLADVHGLSGEGAIPIICSYSGISEPYQDIAVNIPNQGAIGNLPQDALVEVPAMVSRGRIQGVPCAPLAKGIRSLVGRQLEIAELAVEAAVERSYSKALQALAIDPIVTDLRFAQAYLDDILAAHKDLVGEFSK